MTTYRFSASYLHHITKAFFGGVVVLFLSMVLFLFCLYKSLIPPSSNIHSIFFDCRPGKSYKYRWGLILQPQVCDSDREPPKPHWPPELKNDLHGLWNGEIGARRMGEPGILWQPSDRATPWYCVQRSGTLQQPYGHFQPLQWGHLVYKPQRGEEIWMLWLFSKWWVWPMMSFHQCLVCM